MNDNYQVLATHGQRQITRNWPLNKRKMNANYQVLATHGQRQITRNWPLNKRKYHRQPTPFTDLPLIFGKISQTYTCSNFRPVMFVFFFSVSF